MVDDAARIAQLEAELRRCDERDAAAQRQIDALRDEVEHVRPALAEALEQRSGTNDLLRIIASSTTP
jgi:chromosome segregation ATPase